MYPSLRRSVGAAILAVSALAGSLNAEYIVDQSGCFAGMDCCKPVRPCYGYAYNPPTFMADCCGWTAGIDFLYFKYRQDCISFGREVRLESYEAYDPATNVIVSGTGESTNKYVDTQWNAGFRLAIGYKGACDCWDLNLTFTHFNPEEVNAHVATQFINQGNLSSGTIFYPAYSSMTSATDIALFPDGFSRFVADAELKFRFNQLDLDMSREFFVGRCVTLKPIFGIRALFVDEKYEIIYTAATTGAGAISFNEDIFMENEFKGVGLKGGLEASYGIGCGLAFYGNATGSITYGEFETNQDHSLVLTAPIGTGTNSDTGSFKLHNTNRYNTLLSGADLALGINWTQTFNCDKSAFSFKVGYEHHVLYDYNKFTRISILDEIGASGGCCPSGDLVMYGIVVGANVAF